MLLSKINDDDDDPRSNVDQMNLARDLLVEVFSKFTFSFLGGKTIVRAFVVENVVGRFQKLIFPHRSPSFEFNLSFLLKLDVLRPNDLKTRVAIELKNICEDLFDISELHYEVDFPSYWKLSEFERNQILGMVTSNKAKSNIKKYLSIFILMCRKEILKENVEFDFSVLSDHVSAKISKKALHSNNTMVAVVPNDDDVDWMNDSEDDENNG